MKPHKLWIYHDIIDLVALVKCPPTPAFAKAGAAPGTTGGVDPVFLDGLCHAVAVSLSCSRVAALHLCHAHTAGKRHHKATAMAQEHPTAAAMASYRRSRLPAVPALQPAVCLHSALSLGRPCLGHAVCRQKPPQGHSNGSRHPPGRSNGFL